MPQLTDADGRPGSEGRDLAVRSEQLQLRNYDETRRYVVTLRVAGPGPDREVTYDLAPMERRSVAEIAPPGRYDARVEGSFVPTDGAEGGRGRRSGADTDTAVCNVGRRPAQTILVECGNGIVTLSEGL